MRLAILLLITGTSTAAAQMDLEIASALLGQPYGQANVILPTKI
jgi:hypothetical protein